MADQLKNFAYSTIATAPSPADSGTSLVVAAGHGTRFPAVPFNVVVWPANQQPLASNAEIVRVTNVSTDTFTITREQEGSSARSIQVGDQISQAITKKMLDDKQDVLTGLTSSVSELNILDGVTATAAEINALDGITSTVTELNYIDGVTSAIQTQLDGKQAEIYYTVGSANADYITDGTDDDVQIQQALDAVDAAGGGIVEVKEGTYNISSRLLVYDNTWLRGTGPTTILKKTAGVSNARIITNADDNAPGNSNIYISDLYIDGNYESGDTGIMFNMAHVTNGLVERVWCVNGMQGFKSDSSTDLTYRDCVADGCYNWNFYNFSGTRVKVYNCKSLNAKADSMEGFGIAFYEDCTDCEAVGNYVYNSEGNSLQVNSGSASIDVEGVILRDNRVENSGNRGIMITDDANSFHVKKISVINNKVIGSASAGIYLINAYDAYVAGNKSYSNTGDGLIYENCVKLSSQGNTSTANAAGFRIVGDGTTVVSQGDFIYSNTSNFANITDSGAIFIGPSDLTLDGQSVRTITLNRPYVSAAGNKLTIQAGPATSGGTNLAGGALHLSGGIATGTGRSEIVFNLSNPGSSGTSDVTPIQAAVMGVSSGTTMLGLLRSTTSFGGAPIGTNSMVLNGTAQGSFAMIRHTTSNTAGNAVTVQSGGATSGATDKAGGALNLISGISTGSGNSQVLVRTFTPSSGGGAANDNTVATRLTIDSTDADFSVPVVPTTSDGAALGTTALMWSDLFLASGGVINFNNGNMTITHSAGVLTIAGGTTVTTDLQVNETAYFDAEVDNGSSSTADTIDWGVGNKQKTTLSADCTYTFTAPPGPCNLILKIVHSGASRNPTWPASVKWSGGAEPTWSTTDGAIDIASFYYDGTNYYGMAGIGFA